MPHLFDMQILIWYKGKFEGGGRSTRTVTVKFHPL